MNYDELASFAQSVPRIPKRELRCHPLVIDALRWDTLHCPSFRDPLARMYDLWACPVYQDVTMEPGAWEFFEDDVVVASGNTEGGALMSSNKRPRPKGFDETNVFTAWRHRYAYLSKAGAVAAIKKGYRRRERHTANQQVRRGLGDE